MKFLIYLELLNKQEELKQKRQMNKKIQKEMKIMSKREYALTSPKMKLEQNLLSKYF